MKCPNNLEHNPGLCSAGYCDVCYQRKRKIHIDDICITHNTDHYPKGGQHTGMPRPTVRVVYPKDSVDIPDRVLVDISIGTERNIHKNREKAIQLLELALDVEVIQKRKI